MIDLPAYALLSILAIYLLGGLVKGVLGFGLPIITMSFLPFVVSVEKAIVLSALVQPATNVFQLFSSGGISRAISLSWPLFVTLIPGIIIGSWLLTSLDAQLILLIVGLTIAAYAIHQMTAFELLISPNRRVTAGFGFGLIAGIFGALTSVNGWAFIIYLLGLGTTRREFRSTIALLFLGSGFLISVSFAVVGLLDLSVLIIGLLALIPSFGGMWIGTRVSDHIQGQHFRQVILVALVVVGLVLAMRGAGLL